MPSSRLILILGTSRSGSSWFANILNSHPGCLYSHEPLSKLKDPDTEPLRRELVQNRKLGPGSREALIHAWSQAYGDQCRPPFFAKDFLLSPSWARWACWMTTRALGRGDGVFRRLFSPSPKAKFDLVVKEVGWSSVAEDVVRLLAPELIVIMRHPCAVVASQIRGKDMGLMPPLDSVRGNWWKAHTAQCQALGYDEAEVAAMSELRWRALSWVVSNLAYQAAIKAAPRGMSVVYEDLGQDPMAQAAKAFDFLGWPMTRQTRGFISASSSGKRSTWLNRVMGHHDYFSLYRDPKEAAVHYKDELTPAQQEDILGVVRKHFPLSQYWPENGPPA